MMIKHKDLRAIEPPGYDNRRWRCLDCEQEGRLMELLDKPCVCIPKKNNQGRLLDAIEGKN